MAKIDREVVDVESDPGPELPSYPALPITGDCHLRIEELEAWHLGVLCRCAELGFALEVARSAGAADDVDAIVEHRADFDRRHVHDVAWVSGWMAGRCAGAIGPDEQDWLTPPMAPEAGYRQGWAAGLVASAVRFEDLGRRSAGAARRSIADLVTVTT